MAIHECLLVAPGYHPYLCPPQLERLRVHSSALLETLRDVQKKSAAESTRAREASDEAESLRQRASLLADEVVAVRDKAARREERHREELERSARALRAAESAEVAARDETAATVKGLEVAAREQRELMAGETAESLVRALEEMEQQQSEVLSAALARSDAALGEVARVKEVRAYVIPFCRKHGVRRGGVGLG